MPSASPSCIMDRPSSRARARKSSPIHAPRRSTLASEALRISGIDAYYGDSHVLHGVGFGLQAGRLLALLGRNGAGKTTCMNAVIGFLPPRNGTIQVFGESVTGLAPEAIVRK